MQKGESDHFVDIELNIQSEKFMYDFSDCMLSGTIYHCFYDDTSNFLRYFQILWDLYDFIDGFLLFFIQNIKKKLRLRIYLKNLHELLPGDLPVFHQFFK